MWDVTSKVKNVNSCKILDHNYPFCHNSSHKTFDIFFGDTLKDSKFSWFLTELIVISFLTLYIDNLDHRAIMKDEKENKNCKTKNI